MSLSRTTHVPLVANEGALLTDQLVGSGLPPHHAQVVIGRAEGRRVKEVAAEVGLSERQVKRIAHDHAEQLEAVRASIRLEIAQRTQARLAEATEARLDDAANAESRTGAQSFVAIMRAVGAIDERSQIHVGDVNVSVLDRSEHVHLSLMDPAERQAELTELQEELGLCS